MLGRLLRKAFPQLDFWLSYGATADALSRLSICRDDLQIVLYRGQFRIGYADERHDELDQRIGTVDVGPDPRTWEDALIYAAAFPKKHLEYIG